MTSKSKKMLILYVLSAIKDNASKSNPISQQRICDMLKENNIFCDRKTIGRNINCLIEFGYPIIKVKRKGCYLKEE